MDAITASIAQSPLNDKARIGEISLEDGLLIAGAIILAAVTGTVCWAAVNATAGRKGLGQMGGCLLWSGANSLCSGLMMRRWLELVALEAVRELP